MKRCLDKSTHEHTNTEYQWIGKEKEKINTRHQKNNIKLRQLLKMDRRSEVTKKRKLDKKKKLYIDFVKCLRRAK